MDLVKEVVIFTSCEGYEKQAEYTRYGLDFNKLISNDFAQRWQQAQQTKQINFYNTSLISWVIDNTTVNYDHIWESNIFDYKWTLLHTTHEQYIQYRLKLK